MILFITLSVIVAMMALVGVIFTYLHKSKESASHTAALIQGDILFRDSRDVIDQLLKQNKKDKEVTKAILDMLYLAPVTLQAEGSESYATLTCQPLNRAVNINWLALQEDEKGQKLYEMAQNIFDIVIEKYEIQNGSTLLSKINGNINLTSKTAQKKGIISVSQLQDIVREYRFESDDDEKIMIPWENYFSFDLESKSINGNYISAELIAILFDMDLATIEEEWMPGGDLKLFLDNNGGNTAKYDSKLFAPNTNQQETEEMMQCRVLYSYQEESYAFEFKYLDGRATEFDFYGKQ